MTQSARVADLARYAPLALVLVSVLVAIVAYWPAFYFDFVSDDLSYITNNAKLLGLRLPELWRLAVEPYNPVEFLPLRDLSYWLDIRMFGLDPVAFRLHNIILYLLSVPLVYAITFRMWKHFRDAGEDARWPAAVVTALFVVHPAHVEAVVWISSRKDVLSGLFSLFALWLAVKARRANGLSPSCSIGAMMALLAAMLSKAAAVAVAPLIALIWVVFRGDIDAKDRRGAQLGWPAAVLVLAASIALIFANASTIKLPSYFGMEANFRTLAVLGWLARLTFSPEGRHYLHPVVEDSSFVGMAALGIVILVAAVAGVVELTRARSLAGLAVAAFALFCAPYAQLTPYITNSLVADRFVFLAVWPGMLLIVLLAWRLKPLPRLALLLAVAMIFTVRSVERSPQWQSLESLIDVDYGAAPGNYQLALQRIFYFELPRGIYGEAAATADKIAIPEARDIMVKLVDAEVAVHNASVSGDPSVAVVRLRNLGPLLAQPLQQAKWNPPMFDFWMRSRNYFVIGWQEMVKRFPDQIAIRYIAGRSLFDAHEFENAIGPLRAASASPQLPEAERSAALVFLGAALLNSNHIVEAEAPLRAALAQPLPDYRAYCVLAEMYSRTGRVGEARGADAACRGRTSSAGNTK